MNRHLHPGRSLGVAVALGLAALGAARPASAAELHVVCSGGFAAALRELAPQFERATGHRLVLGWGPSMGTTKDAIPTRFQRGEAMDVLVMVGSALGELAKAGKVAADSRVDLARSPIGVAVRKGAPRPDIGSAEALKATLLAARSIAYSDSASGVYVSTELFRRLGISEQMKVKARMIPAEPVAQVVARGEAELGFQQVSEILPVPGAELVGPLPAELQKITVFSAGVVQGSKFPREAKAFVDFLASPDAAGVVARSGLEPVVAKPASR